jgi:AraC-like DNA-binding protein
MLSAAAATHVPLTGRHASWVRCEPGWAWRYRIPDFDLWAVTSGTGLARLAGESIELSAGTVLMLRPGDEVDVDQDEDDRLQVGYCHYDYPTRPDAAVLTPRVVRLTDPAGFSGRLRAVISAVRRDDASGPVQASADLAALLMEMHVQAARSQCALRPAMDHRVRIAIDLLRSRLGRRTTLAEAAGAAKLSPDTFSRLFHTETGRPFREYCVAARIERARELLSETALNVTEVARALGYSDYRLFARQFAQHTQGYPPSRWRGSHPG